MAGKGYIMLGVYVQQPSIYKFGLSVCLYPINVKMADPIGPKFLGKVYE